MAVHQKSLERIIPFDQYSRQYQVRAILDLLRANSQVFRILDVGGYLGHTADFLDKDEVVVMDLYDADEEGYVKGSALKMPFKKQEFDYALSFDVLEHIPPDIRMRFFDECARVAKRGVIICAPSSNEANKLAELNLSRRYEALHKKPHQWLKEHIEYGIPDFTEIASYAESKGYKTARFHSNKIQLWAAMQEAIFLNSRYSLAAEDIEELNLFYNTHILYDGGGEENSAYRSILCCVKDDVSAKKLQQFGPINEPIDPTLEVELIKKIGDFNATLVGKTTALANDYKRLYKHEKRRAETLQSNNEVLHERVTELIKIERRTLRGLVRAIKRRTAYKRGKS